MLKNTVSIIPLGADLNGCSSVNGTGDTAANEAALNEALYANLDMPSDIVAISEVRTPPLSAHRLVSVGKAATHSWALLRGVIENRTHMGLPPTQGAIA
jgi:hypothetical protein